MLGCLIALDAARGIGHAQSLRLALFKTASESAEQQPLAAALDPVLLAELGKLPDVQIAARPALDLPSLQLATDCVGETPECLAQAASQSGADGLLAPSVRKIGEELVVTLLLFRGAANGGIKASARRYPVAHAEQTALDGVHGQLAELFGTAPSAPAPAPAPVKPQLPAAPEPQPAPQPTAAHSRFPILPVAIGAAGVALLAGGVAFGIASQSAENDYKNTIVRNTADAASAWHKYQTANTRATVADVGFAVGGACAIGAVVLFLVERSSERSTAPQTQVSVGLGAVSLSRSWN